MKILNPSYAINYVIRYVNIFRFTCMTCRCRYDAPLGNLVYHKKGYDYGLTFIKVVLGS